MKSNRRKITQRLHAEVAKRNAAAGFVVQGASQARIVGYGLVKSGLMVGGITHESDAESVVIGSPIRNPPYPFFLHNGFRHHITKELVGPFPFLTEGLDDSKGALAAIYGREMRA